MRVLTRAGAVAAATAGLMLVGSGAALAHNCYLASISEKGAAGIAHSGKWEVIPRAGLLAELPGMLADDFGATPEQVACGMAYATANLPETIVLGVGPAKGTDHTVAARANPKTLGNGTGVDNLEVMLGGMFTACQIAPPQA